MLRIRKTPVTYTYNVSRSFYILFFIANRDQSQSSAALTLYLITISRIVVILTDPGAEPVVPHHKHTHTAIHITDAIWCRRSRSPGHMDLVTAQANTANVDRKLNSKILQITSLRVTYVFLFSLHKLFI